MRLAFPLLLAALLLGACDAAPEINSTNVWGDYYSADGETTLNLDLLQFSRTDGTEDLDGQIVVIDGVRGTPSYRSEVYKARGTRQGDAFTISFKDGFYESSPAAGTFVGTVQDNALVLSGRMSGVPDVRDGAYTFRFSDPD